MVRQGISLKQLTEPGPDVLVPRDHRKAFWHVGHWLDGGVIVAVCYLHTGQGDGDINQAVLHQVGGVLRAWCRPYLVLADWQMQPLELQGTGWPAAVVGKVVGPRRPTCIAAGTAREIDYFLVDCRMLQHVRGVVVDEGIGIRPHRAVVLSLACGGPAQMIKKIRKPKPYPKRRPYGPQPRPPDWEPLCSETPRVGNRAWLDDFCARWMDLYEEEMAGIFDLRGQRQYTGRTDEPRVVWAKQLPGGSRYPKTRQDEAFWRWLADRVIEWDHLRGLEGEARRHAQPLLNKLRRFRPTSGSTGCETMWAFWRASVRKLHGLPGHAVHEVANRLRAHAVKMEARAATARFTAWTQWAKSAVSESGGKAAFRWIREPAPWAQATVKPDGGLRGQQEEVEARARAWHDLWTDSEGLGAVQWGELGGCHDLMPAVEDVRQCAATFKGDTALGVDSLSPRHIGLLSDMAIQALIRLWMTVVDSGCIPKQLAALIVVMLPKPVGGERPIALFPGALRLLTRWLRHTYGAKWQHEHPNCAWYGEAGRAVDQGVWTQAMHAEYAVAQGQEAAGILIDLRKAYENLHFDHLLTQAREFGFDLRVFRLLIALYSMTRLVQWEGCVAEGCNPTKAVAAGCSFADLMMRLALMGIIGRVQDVWSSIRLVVVVDDIQLLATGSHMGVVAPLSRAYAMLTAALTAAKLKLAEDKLVMLSTSSDVAASLAKRHPALRKALVRSARNLGADFSAGRNFTGAVRHKRYLKVRGRCFKIRRLKKAGAECKKLVTMGVTPAAVYGMSVTGATRAQTWRLRAAAHTALHARTAGRSATVDLALASRDPTKVDPIYKCYTAPIFSLSACLWEDWLPRGWVVRTLAGAARRLDAAKSLWGRVNGPCAAALASMQRIGWTLAVETMRVTTETGFTFSLLTTCPRTVQSIAHSDIHGQLLERAATKHEYMAGLAHRPYLEPLAKLVHAKSRPDWDQRHKGMLKAIAANGIWPQHRLWTAGLVSSPDCCICGVPGTLRHRYYWCTGPRAFRDSYGLPGAMLRMGKGLGAEEHAALWCHALMPDPTVWLPRPAQELQVHWQVETASGTLDGSGPVYGDGSAFWPTCRDRTRAGWAVVQVEMVGGAFRVQGALYGPLPGPIQSSPAAEAMALLMFLRHAGPSSRVFYTDCAWVLTCWQGGPACCTGAQHVHADLWRQIFSAAGARSGITVRKVKAHLTEEAVLRGEVAPLDWFGNDQADTFAKRAAACHPRDEEAERRCDRAAKAVTVVGKFLARLAVNWLDAGSHDQTPKAQRLHRERRSGFGGRFCKPTQHLLRRQGTKWRCARCLRVASAPGHILAQDCGAAAGHRLFQAGPTVFCGACGAFSRARTRLLLTGCRGRPTVAGRRALTFLRRGKDPTSGSWLGDPQKVGREAFDCGVAQLYQVLDRVADDSDED